MFVCLYMFAVNYLVSYSTEAIGKKRGKRGLFDLTVSRKRMRKG